MTLNVLILSTLWAKSADDELMSFFLFLFFQGLRLHANYLHRYSYLAEKINRTFLQKMEDILKCRLLIVLPSMLRVKMNEALLTFITLWTNSADNKLIIFFNVFPRKSALIFYANCLLKRQFA